MINYTCKTYYKIDWLGIVTNFREYIRDFKYYFTEHISRPIYYKKMYKVLFHKLFFSMEKQGYICDWR
jgi:hypothetical protein